MLQAFHEVFVLAALEGQSLFAAAGDSGAFNTVRRFGTTDFTFPLSIGAVRRFGDNRGRRHDPARDRDA